MSSLISSLIDFRIFLYHKFFLLEAKSGQTLPIRCKSTREEARTHPRICTCKYKLSFPERGNINSRQFLRPLKIFSRSSRDVYADSSEIESQKTIERGKEIGKTEREKKGREGRK